MIRDWLVERCESTDWLDVAKADAPSLGLSAEQAYGILQRRNFGSWVDAQWKPFIAMMQPGDELWRFRSPDDTWDDLAGSAGYAIMREGKVIHAMVTMRS
jgi:hypothetical protein